MMKLSRRGRAVLLEAAKTVTRGWTQRVLARDRDGGAVEPYNKAATCWCAVGAVELADPGLDTDALSYLGLYLFKVEGCGYLYSTLSVPDFNDQIATCSEQVAQALCGAAGL